MCEPEVNPLPRLPHLSHQTTVFRHQLWNIDRRALPFDHRISTAPLSIVLYMAYTFYKIYRFKIHSTTVCTLYFLYEGVRKLLSIFSNPVGLSKQDTCCELYLYCTYLCRVCLLRTGTTAGDAECRSKIVNSSHFQCSAADLL